ncbi:kinase-like protein, partial [Gloeophyllum trabeum ATCC 11539]
EADTMRFIASNTSIPVPTVFRHWSVSPRDDAILMEWLDDTYTLQDRWTFLTEEDKLKIARQIRASVDQLRGLRQPDTIQGMICPIDPSQKVYDERVKGQPCGPFESERAFNEYRLSLLDHFLWEPGAQKDIENIRTHVREDHRIVFTHGDIGKRNILVDEHNSVVAIIDWEMAGWMPEYWEWIK